MNHMNPVQLHVLVSVASVTGSVAEIIWDQVAGQQLNVSAEVF